MKAAYIEAQGSPEVLQYGNVLDPIESLGKAVVDIHAASVNAADWKVRSGAIGPIKNFPYILGRDFSGVVRTIGDDVLDVAVGDEVFGVCEIGQEGAYAERIAIKSSILASKPKNLSHLEAAALAATGLTALISIEDTIKLVAGETILIQGGAGGVAGLAIQLAKQIGAYVITTASATNHDYLRDLGADECIDYTTQEFTERVSGCDAVFETVGGEVAMRSFEVLRPGGRIAFIASGPIAPNPLRDDITALRPTVNRDRIHLDRIVDLFSTGAIRTPEISTFHLQEAAKAHRISESRHARGKLVFKVR